MRRPTIVIIETDTRYIAPLEQIFAEKFARTADIEIITDEKYYYDFFSQPKKISVVMVSEKLYHEQLLRHDIGQLFVLAEEQDPEKAFPAAETIYKYTSAQEVFHKVAHLAADELRAGQQSGRATHVVVFSSAGGGVGKTVTALGTGVCLAAAQQKVLYVDAEYTHTFQYRLQEKSSLSDTVYESLKPSNAKIFEDIRPFLRTEHFDYVPPFQASVTALGLKFEMYKHLIEAAKATGEYDFILVDVDAVYAGGKADLFKLADKVVVVFTPEQDTVFKTELLRDNMDTNDGEKYLFVCNRYAGAIAGGLPVNEFIEEKPGMEAAALDELAGIAGFQKLALLLQ
ncbi:MAG: AAA family ATPase [Clostridiales Family XIII bacterium]|jgi:MinD-like ATPase involved in chromosome partitioning or flagellar assembly|nr:AAA family ATPase [Clostridiales Family XIII bacterium]